MRRYSVLVTKDLDSFQTWNMTIFMIIYYKGPLCTQWHSWTQLLCQHTTTLHPSHQGTDIPLPGQAAPKAKHVAGCEHTAHLGFLENWYRTNLAKSITATSLHNDKVHIFIFISYFLVKSQVSSTSLNITQFVFSKEVLSYRHLFPLTLLLCYSHHPTITSLPFNHVTFEDHRCSDLPTCQ